MRYLLTLSFVAMSLGLILVNYSVDATERYYARFVVAAGIAVFLITVMVG